MGRRIDLNADLGEGGCQADETLALDRVTGRVPVRWRDRAVASAPAEPGGDHADAPVTESGQGQGQFAAGRLLCPDHRDGKITFEEYLDRKYA